MEGDSDAKANSMPPTENTHQEVNMSASGSLQVSEKHDNIKEVAFDNNAAYKNKRKRDIPEAITDKLCGKDMLNEFTTIEDLASIDASTYMAWVSRQSNSLPNVFIANETESKIEPRVKAMRREEPIDGSAATVQVLFSKQMGIFPPRTARHLPPMDTNIADKSNDNENKGHSSMNKVLCTCSQWISATISNFSELRSHIEQIQSQMIEQHRQHQRDIVVPRMKDRAAWHVFCLGKEEAYGNAGGYFEESYEEIKEEYAAEIDEHDVNEESDGEVNTSSPDVARQSQSHKVNVDTDQELKTKDGIYDPQLVPPNGYPPTLSLLLQFDQVLTRFLFHHHIHFFCEWKFPLTHNRAAWIYALLARMEKPWHREECSAVRRLLRECCARRWELVLPEKRSAASASLISGLNKNIEDSNNATAMQGGDMKVWESLALLNTLIAVTGLYYEQGSFAGGDSKYALFEVPLEGA
ncbi:hypothetical protein HJC23_013957 [Cyclotella cryptica]|uniref:Gem-associated protein 2 n=1 Tax=Cyclotella cryptica TaxID=29204 RepID=A0ABD3Q209_9STRA|eukprot:CCRYP_009203-RA/>CCRYP_009203-RA protein AED:0.14 eAED:0.14 QI:0/-1/0/1/-1/1/1/0/466